MVVDDIIRTARLCVGNARYCFCSEHSRGLDIVNCHMFIQALFGNHGVVLPSSFYRLLRGSVVVFRDRYEPGHLLLTRALWGGICLPGKGICGGGHVGLITDCETVIHASFRHGTVVEEPLAPFLCDNSQFCGILGIPT